MGKVSNKILRKDARKRRADGTSMAASESPSRQDRIVTIVMSLAAAAIFGGLGIAAVSRHSVTWPGRSGLLHSTGAAADMFGWLLLGIAAVFLIHLTMAVRPGKAGVRWIAGIITAWVTAVLAYYMFAASK